MGTTNPQDAVNQTTKTKLRKTEELIERQRAHVEALHRESDRVMNELIARTEALANLPRWRGRLFIDERGEVSSPIFGRRGRWINVAEEI